MLTILNSESLWIGTDMIQFNAIRDILDREKIKYKYKTYNHLGEWAGSGTLRGNFGSVEEHYKYRDAVKKAYPYSHFPLFQDENHMQMQILDPKGFAKMLDSIIRTGKLMRIVSEH